MIFICLSSIWCFCFFASFNLMSLRSQIFMNVISVIQVNEYSRIQQRVSTREHRNVRPLCIKYLQSLLGVLLHLVLLKRFQPITFYGLLAIYKTLFPNHNYIWKQFPCPFRSDHHDRRSLEPCTQVFRQVQVRWWWRWCWWLWWLMMERRSQNESQYN